MALVQRKISKRKQLKLIAALASVIAITALVAYYGLLKKPAAYTPSAANVPILGASGEQFRIPGQTGYEAAEELSESPIFHSLRSFGVWPLSSNPKGNSQPFILREE